MHERNHVKYYTHNLTTQLIRYIKEKYKEGIFIFRDTKGIKRINYPPIYRVVLDRWGIEMQKQFLDYKERLKNFHIYNISYKDSNNLKCSRCGKEILEENKPIKVLTVKLRHGFNKKSILTHKINMLQKKILKLQKYPQTKEMMQYIQETNKELRKVKNLLDKEDGTKDYKQIKCDCGYNQDFIINDALTLHSLFLRGTEAEQEHAS